MGNVYSSKLQIIGGGELGGYKAPKMSTMFLAMFWKSIYDFGQGMRAKNNVVLPILNERVLRFDDLSFDLEVSSFYNRWTYRLPLSLF